MSAALPRCTLWLPLLLHTGLSWSAETPDTDAVVLETVVVTDSGASPYAVRETSAATRLNLSPRDTPQSLTTFTRERIEDQNLQSLRDVLDNTNGVYSYSYDSERVVFSARGFTIDNTLYDGVPVAPGLNTGSSDASLDTALYERIEIVRGATGLMSGAGNPSAAINFVRKHADARTPEGMLTLTAASWNDLRTTADVSTPLSADGRVRARAVAVYQHRDSYMDLYENEKRVFYGVVDADLTPSTRLSLGYDDQATRPQGNTWGSFPLFFSDGSRTHWRRSITTATRWSYWNNDTRTVFAELRHRFGNGWSLRSSVQRRETDGHSNLFYVYGYPDRDTGEGLFPYAYRSEDAGRQNTADAYLSAPFTWRGLQHEWLIGATGSWLRGDADEFAHGEMADTGSFYDWDGSYPEPMFDRIGTDIQRNRTRQHAAYSALRLALAEPLKLIVGARATRYRAEQYYLYDGPETFQQDHDRITPYAGLIYDLGSQWSAFGSYTQIFKPQNLQQADGTYLDPLDGYSQEVGIKGAHFGGRLNTALTVFDTRQDHVGVSDVGRYVNDDPTRPAYRQADGTRTRGIEAEASGSPVHGWNLSLGVSHFRMQDGDGETIRRYVPRSLVRAFSSYTLPGDWQALTVGGSVNWQSASEVEAAQNYDGDMQTIRQGSVPLLGLMARYAFDAHWTLQVNGNNLLDRRYYVLDEYANLAYGAPANVAATLSYRF